MRALALALLVSVLSVPAIATAQTRSPFNSTPYPGTVARQAQPTEGQLDRAIKQQVLERLVREEVRYDAGVFNSPPPQTAVGAGIQRSWENYQVETETQRLLQDQRRR